MAKESSAERISPITRANYFSNGSADNQQRENEFDPLTALADMVGDIKRDILAGEASPGDNAQVDMESELIEGLHDVEQSANVTSFQSAGNEEAKVDLSSMEQGLSDMLAGEPDIETASGEVANFLQADDIHAVEPGKNDEDTVRQSFEALNAEFEAALSSRETPEIIAPEQPFQANVVQPAFSHDDTAGQNLETPYLSGEPQKQEQNDESAVVPHEIPPAEAVMQTDVHDSVPPVGPDPVQQTPAPQVPQYLADPIETTGHDNPQVEPFKPSVENPEADTYLDANLAAEFDTALAGSIAEMVSAAETAKVESAAENDGDAQPNQPYVEEQPSSQPAINVADELVMPPVETPFDQQVDTALGTIIEEAPEEKGELGWTGDLAGELERILASSVAEGGEDAGTESQFVKEPALQIRPKADEDFADLSPEFDVRADISAFEQDFAEQMDTSSLDDPFMQDTPPAQSQDRRGGMWVAAIVLGVAVLAGGGAFGWNYFFFPSSDGPAKIVLASTDPVKIKPKEPGGVEIPNQNQVVFDKVNGKSAAEPEQAKLASGMEKPIRVVPTFSVDPISSSNAPAGAPVIIIETAKSTERITPGNTVPGNIDTVLIRPRKVRTVVVRPDGTIVLTVEAKPVKTSTIKLAAARSVPLTTGETGKVNATRVVSVDPIEKGVKSTGKIAAPKVKPVPRPVIEAPKTTQPKSVVAAPKVEEPKPVAAKKVKLAKKTAPAAVVTASKGGYGMQISSQRSVKAAQASYNRLSRQFAGILGGRGVDIRRTELKGKGIYFRVQVPAGSKKAAINLCMRYKAAGGSCFVTR